MNIKETEEDLIPVSKELGDSVACYESGLVDELLLNPGLAKKRGLVIIDRVKAERKRTAALILEAIKRDMEKPRS